MSGNQGRRVFWCALVAVFLLALIPRVVYPVSRPMQWYTRSVGFWNALLEGDLSGTYQQYHPGVTTMWIAGLGLQAYAATHGWSGDELLDPPRPPLTSPDFIPYPVEAGVVALGVFISVCICLAYAVLVRLLGWWAGFVGACLLALDPFYLEQSKVLHVDAILATLMLLSALFLVSYLQYKRLTSLVFSGAFAGLAFLTKSPSIFLLPYAALSVVLRHLEDGFTDLSRGRTWIGRVGKIIRDLAMWGLAAGGTFVLCWPAVWVAPGEVLSEMVKGSGFHAGIEHVNPNFFAGRVVYGDVGPFFYLATIAWKTTVVTLPLILVTIFSLRRVKHWKDRKPMWWLLLYACGFVAMMTLAAGKEMRYVLPAFLALDLLAAWGLLQVVDAIRRSWAQRQHAWVSAAVMLVVLIIQAVTVLRYHPYYGVYYNSLLGGAQVAQHVLPIGDQGEGMDSAARFLNSYPGAERRRAGVHRRLEELFEGIFVGYSVGLEKPDLDYYVFAINNIQRHNRAEFWEKAWEDCQDKEPLWSISFDGIPYVWVYPAYPSDPAAFTIDHHLDVQLGEHVRLLGYRLSSDTISEGDGLTVTLFWQSDGRLTEGYHVFVHLLNEEGQMVAQHDGEPVGSERPTWDWRDREVIQDEHTLVIESDSPAGTYTLSTGLYDAATGLRLPAVGPNGERLPDDRVVLQDMRVESP
jgi:hypothetical protein